MIKKRYDTSWQRAPLSPNKGDNKIRNANWLGTFDQIMPSGVAFSTEIVPSTPYEGMSVAILRQDVFCYFLFLFVQVDGILL